MPQFHYLSLCLGHGRGSLWPSSLKNFKIPKVCLSDSIPLNPKRHTCLDAPSVPVAHYEIVHYLLHLTHVFSNFSHEFWAFPVTERHKILHHHFSSWLQSRESTQNPWNPWNSSISSSRKKQNLDHTHFLHNPDPVIWQNLCRKTQISTLS